MTLAQDLVDVPALIVVDGADDWHVGTHNFLVVFWLILITSDLLHAYLRRKDSFLQILIAIFHIIFNFTALILVGSRDLTLLYHLQVAKVRTRAGICEYVLLRHGVISKIPNLNFVATIEVGSIAIFILSQSELMLCFHVLSNLLDLNCCDAALVLII